MNKNVFLRMVSAVLVLTVLFVCFGCNKGEEAAGVEGEATAATAVSATNGIIQPPIENGTVVVQFPSKNAQGEEVMVTTVKDVDDFRNTLSAGKVLDQLDQAQKERLIARCADFGIDEAKAKEITQDGTSWTMFSVMIYVANSNRQGVSIGSVKATNTDSILIDRQLGCEYGLPSGNSTYIQIEGIVDSSKLQTEEDIIAALQAMDISLVYTCMDNPQDSVDDWSKVTTVYMPVNF